jgi:hypothetical protein
MCCGKKVPYGLRVQGGGCILEGGQKRGFGGSSQKSCSSSLFVPRRVFPIQGGGSPEPFWPFLSILLKSGSERLGSLGDGIRIMSFSDLLMAFRHLLRMRCYRRVLRQIFRKDLEIPVTSALMELLRKEDLTRDAWDGFRAIPVGLV